MGAIAIVTIYDLKIIDILPDLFVCLVETSKSTVSSIAVHEKRNVALLRWLDPFFFSDNTYNSLKHELQRCLKRRRKSNCAYSTCRA